MKRRYKLDIYDKNHVFLARITEFVAPPREELKLNSRNTFEFKLLKQDYKNQYCQPFNEVRFNDGDPYRIIGAPIEEQLLDTITYTCEHAIASLIDSPLPKYHQIGGLGIYTPDVIRYVLNHQLVRDWELGQCDFMHQYEYGFEKLNLYQAFMSIPERFVSKYILKYSTNVRPYKVHLLALNENATPKLYVRNRTNQLSLRKNIDYSKIVTRIYPYGAGEGVNQINIEKLNNGLPYIQAEQKYIDLYGYKAMQWVDRRYDYDYTLLDAAKVILNELKEPYKEWDCEFVGDLDIGDIVEIVGETRTFVVQKNIEYDDYVKMSYVLANKTKDVASTIADFADRLNIEMTCSQGATQIYADGKTDNCDGKDPVEFDFYIDNDMLKINKIMCRIKIGKFRVFGKTIKAGGAIETSSEGGGITTSDEGGDIQTSSEGGSIQASSPAGKANKTSGASSKYTVGASEKLDNAPKEYTGGVVGTTVDRYHQHEIAQVLLHTHQMDHTHEFETPEHSHTINTTHSHKLNTRHNHRINTSHRHTLNTTHTHEIVPTIERYGNATGFWLYLNNVLIGFYATTDLEINIVNYLTVAGTIPRGKFHTIGVVTNDSASISITCNVKGFCQSRGGTVA